MRQGLRRLQAYVRLLHRTLRQHGFSGQKGAHEDASDVRGLRNSLRGRLLYYCPHGTVLRPHLYRLRRGVQPLRQGVRETFRGCDDEEMRRGVQAMREGMPRYAHSCRRGEDDEVRGSKNDEFLMTNAKPD